jgi:hypothetical protein
MSASDLFGNNTQRRILTPKSIKRGNNPQRRVLIPKSLKGGMHASSTTSSSQDTPLGQAQAQSNNSFRQHITTPQPQRSTIPQSSAPPPRLHSERPQNQYFIPNGADDCMMPSNIPYNLTETERRAYVTAYRLRRLNNALSNQLQDSSSTLLDLPPDYKGLRDTILAANGLPMYTPGVKRKFDDGAAELDDAEDVAPPGAWFDPATGAYAGPENEDIFFEVEVKALEHDKNPKTGMVEWIFKGAGTLRVLKHKEHGVCRIIISRAGEIVLNTALMSSVEYKVVKEKMVMFLAANAEGGLEKWMVKVGRKEDAEKLRDILQAEKEN